MAARWFAPSELKRRAERTAINGAYLPAWTYYSDTDSAYTGERGDDYTVSESYTAYEDSRAVARKRNVTRTRWSSVQGQVANRFDDILVMASQSLPIQLLAGNPKTVSDTVFEISAFDNKKTVFSTPRDKKRCPTPFSNFSRYAQIRFRHLLLPVWISAYRYRDVTYRFVVNARTGEVCGERRYSVCKIVLLSMLILAVVLIAVFCFQAAR